jgi:hypothetical protein
MKKLNFKGSGRPVSLSLAKFKRKEIPSHLDFTFKLHFILFRVELHSTLIWLGHNYFF